MEAVGLAGDGGQAVFQEEWAIRILRALMETAAFAREVLDVAWLTGDGSPDTILGRLASTCREERHAGVQRKYDTCSDSDR